MASETTYKAKKIVLLIKIASNIMVVGKFQGGSQSGGISPGPPSL